MAARGRGLFSLYIFVENFENLLVRNHRTDFHIILQECSFGDPLPRLSKPFGFVKKHGCQGAGLIFPIYLYRKFKKSSCQKPLDRFPYTFAEMFLWWSSTKVVQAIWIRQKIWPPGGGAYFSYIYIENLKNLLVRNHWTDFHIILQKCSFGDSLPRLFKPFGYVKKHGRQGAGLIFPIYLYRKLKKINCYIILQKYSFGDSVPRLFKPFGFVKKHGCQRVGLIFPIYLYRKIEKSSCQKPLDQFQYNSAKMFPWWPYTKIVQVIVIHQKTWPLGDGAYSLYIYIKNFKNLLLRNRWTEFNVTWQECCFGDPLPRLFKPSWYVKKHGSQGAWLIFRIYLYRKL